MLSKGLYLCTAHANRYYISIARIARKPLSTLHYERAQTKGYLDLHLHSLREHTPYKHGQVDDYQFGGGAGMVIMPEPLSIIIEKLQSERVYDAIIFMTPDGMQLQQKTANRLSLLENIIIICGHYKGIDERIREKYVTLELSIGDYVLSGGELAAAVLTDAIVRLIPGVLNDETSALSDSFQDNLLAPPVYTRPANWKGMQVPEILLCGDPKKIDAWRHDMAMKRTHERRPDMLCDDEKE